MNQLMHNASDGIKKTWYKMPQGVRTAWIMFAITAVSLQWCLGGGGSNAKTVSSANVINDAKNSTINGKDLPIYCVDRQNDASKQVSLSFDAAWGADDTIRILDTLDKYNVKVTFFMTGGWVNDYPDMVREIYARGHDLGNHSENHKQMSKLSEEQNQEEIMKVHNKVKELTGYEMFLFRPPYGDYDSELIKTVYGMNYYPIQWSIDSLDWKDYGVDSIIKRVVESKYLDNGAIILCHNGAKYTADALDSLIGGIQDKGYELVPISQLIIRDDFHMDTAGKQIAD